MEFCKRLLNKLLFPHRIVIAVLVPVAAVLLVYAFAWEGANPIVVYTSYFLSAYALTVLCLRAPALWGWGKDFKQRNKYVVRYTTDAALRMKISLYSSLAINCVYALMQLWLGFTNHSVWFYALAVYYALLGVMRFFLLKEARHDRLGKDKFFEYLIYRLCGILLVLMNLALAAIVTYIVWQNRGFEHGFIMTIAMAAYTFFTLTMAIINIVRYRKYQSPVMSAAKAVSLVAALVSMLSLETAMLTAFGQESDALFRRIITAASGGVVCVAVLTMAVSMIVRSTKEIKKLKGASQHGTERQ